MSERPHFYARPVQVGESRGGWAIIEWLDNGKYLAGCPGCGKCSPRTLTQLDRSTRCLDCSRSARRHKGSVTR